MAFKKVYGSSKQHDCPFCGSGALSMNEQGVPVCIAHKDRVIQNFKCVCGDWLDLLKGKWGPFFRCMSCGTMNFRKGMELNADKLGKDATPKTGLHNSQSFSTQTPSTSSTPPISKPKSSKPAEITVRSDELDFWFE